MTTCKIILTPTTKELKICQALATTSAFNLKLCHMTCGGREGGGCKGVLKILEQKDDPPTK